MEGRQAMPMAIRVDSLTKKSDDLTAVDELSLEIKKEEIFGFLGPNRVGKTKSI